MKISPFTEQFERTRKERFDEKCWYCGFSDGLIYLSYPPKKRCILTEKYKYDGDVCDCKSLVNQWDADEWLSKIGRVTE